MVYQAKVREINVSRVQGIKNGLYPFSINLLRPVMFSTLSETGIEIFRFELGLRSPDNMDQTDNSIEIRTDHEFLLEN